MLVTLRRERGKNQVLFGLLPTCLNVCFSRMGSSKGSSSSPTFSKRTGVPNYHKREKIKYCSKFQLTFRCNPGLRWLCLTLQLWKISWPNNHKFSRKYRLPEWNFLKSSRSSGLTILSPGTKHLKNITIVFPANQSCGSGHNSSCLKLKL